jgi:hypothetical protein
MGLSIPACLASLVALAALVEGSGVPYQPMTPPAAKMSGSAKPAEPAKAAPPSALPSMTAPRPYQPLPPPPAKASPSAKSASPTKASELAKTAPPPPPAAASAATAQQPAQALPTLPAKPSPPVKAAMPAKPGAPAKTAAGRTVAPGPASAPSTIVYVIRRTEDAWTVMDPAAIETIPGGPIRRAYSVTVRRNLLNGGPPQPGYVRTLNEFDCDAMKFRWRNFTIYNRFGSVVVKQENADPAFGALGRGSEEEDVFRTVCDGGGGGSVVAAPSLGLLVIGLMQGWDEAAMAGAMSQLPPAPEPKPAAKPRSKPRR